jgi:hypothetical protein
MDMQAKILRVLQDRRFMHLGGTSEIQVDVRIVAATNVNLQQAVRDGRFREDLFYRLNVISLELPPLRQRREDIPLLAQHFLRFYAQENGTKPPSLLADALRVLMDYEWPGNVRELENAMERGVVLSTTRTITPDLLPSQLTGTTYSPRCSTTAPAPRSSTSWKRSSAASSPTAWSAATGTRPKPRSTSKSPSAPSTRRSSASTSKSANAHPWFSPCYWADIFTQMDSIGVGSMPIIVLTGFFTGCVLALQSATALQEFGAVSMTGSLVSLSMVKELGPVLTGLMVSGRNAAGMASELGSMKVTEQLDAMRALGTDPIRKLVTPRLVATIFMLFFLTIIADALGIIGGAHRRVICSASMEAPTCTAPTVAWSTPTSSRASPNPSSPVHHRHRRLLLRHEDHRRHPGRRPRHHPGRRRLLRLHHHRRPPRHPRHDRHLRADARVLGDWLNPLACPKFTHHRPQHPVSMPLDPQPRPPPVVVSTDVSIPSTVKPVLENISFSVEHGQTLIILGPAGCGKSVLMKLANGLLCPDSGSIRVFGEEITAMRERDLYKLRARIGMVFQESALFDSLTVEDNVAYRLNEEHIPEDEEQNTRVVESSSSSSSRPPSPSSLRALRRHAPPRLHRPRHHHQPRPHPLRLPHRRPRPHHLHHHHRAGHEAARRLPHHLAARHPPPAGRLHPRHPPLEQPKPTRWNPSPTGIDDSTRFLVLNEGSSSSRARHPRARQLHRPLAQGISQSSCATCAAPGA